MPGLQIRVRTEKFLSYFSTKTYVVGSFEHSKYMFKSMSKEIIAIVACAQMILIWTYEMLNIFIPPQTLFVVGILFSRCLSVRASARPSVTLCFLNILKSHGWIFIKPCKHVHICKTNT